MATDWNNIMQTSFWREYSKQMFYCIALRQHAFKHCYRKRGWGTSLTNLVCLANSIQLLNHSSPQIPNDWVSPSIIKKPFKTIYVTYWAPFWSSVLGLPGTIGFVIQFNLWQHLVGTVAFVITNGHIFTRKQYFPNLQAKYLFKGLKMFA